MRNRRMEFGVLILLASTIIGYAQKQRAPTKPETVSVQSREEPCPTPVWSSYPKSEVQQQTVNKLASDLIAIKRNARLTQEQIDGLAEDLATAADKFVKDETDLIMNLAKNLAKALAGIRVPKKIKTEMADDLWMVLNMSIVGSGSLSATARVCNRLTDYHASYSDMRDVAYYLNTFLAKAEKKGAMKGE